LRIRNLKCREVPMWLPEWWIVNQEVDEKGVLEKIQLRNDQTPECISVVANHFGDDRKGIMILKDSTHLYIIEQKLKANTSKPPI